MKIARQGLIAGGTALFQRVDVTDAAQVEAMVEGCREAFGAVDVLVQIPVVVGVLLVVAVRAADGAAAVAAFAHDWRAVFGFV